MKKIRAIAAIVFFFVVFSCTDFNSVQNTPITNPAPATNVVAPVIVKTKETLPVKIPAIVVVPVVKPAPAPIALAPESERIIEVAKTYLHVRESKGSNRSPEIDAWNKLTKVPMGSPYCASFISAVHKEAGVKAVISAWSPSWFPASNVIKPSQISKGDVGGLFYSKLKRIGHVYLIDSVGDTYVTTVEGNTSPSAAIGSASDREGDGVFNKRRNKKLVLDSRNKFSRFHE